MPLRRLFRLAATVLALATALLLLRVGVTEWRLYNRAAAGLQATDRLRVALRAAEMVSRERGPTNAVLGEASPPRPERAQALAEARQRSDTAFAAYAKLLAEDSADPAYRQAGQELAAAAQALQLARAAVDHTAALDKAERGPQVLRDNVGAMVAVVPMLAPGVGMLAARAQTALPELGDAVQGARLSAEFREYAGLLGSHFTAALTRQQPFTPGERSAIERTRGRIDELRFLIELRVQVPGQSVAVLQAWRSVVQQYGDTAGRLLASVIANGETDGRYGLDPAGFAAQYVPPMNTILGLRDVLLDQARAMANAEREQAGGVLAAVALASLLLVALLAAMYVQLERRILQPLALTTRALDALSRNEPEVALPSPEAEDEMAAVVGAVKALQSHARQREALELERDELIARLRDQSNTDFLTGLPNRRAFFASAERDLAQARRHGGGVVAILLDIDHFKQVNDTHGHAVGDEALASVAETVRRSLRQGDLVARFGGEEFVVLLVHADRDSGLRFAERLRSAVSEVQVLGQDGLAVHCTASLGLADSERFGLHIDTLLSHADAAMYLAKQRGRNRVEVAELPAA